MTIWSQIYSESQERKKGEQSDLEKPSYQQRRELEAEIMQRMAAKKQSIIQKKLCIQVW